MTAQRSYMTVQKGYTTVQGGYMTVQMVYMMVQEFILRIREVKWWRKQLTLPSHCQHCKPSASALNSFVSVGTWVWSLVLILLTHFRWWQMFWSIKVSSFHPITEPGAVPSSLVAAVAEAWAEQWSAQQWPRAVAFRSSFVFSCFGTQRAPINRDEQWTSRFSLASKAMPQRSWSIALFWALCLQCTPSPSTTSHSGNTHSSSKTRKTFAWWNIGVHWRRRQLTDTDLNELARLLGLWLCWGKSGPNCPSLRLPLLHTHLLSPLLHTHTVPAFTHTHSVSHTQNVVAMHAQTCRYASDPHG